MEMDEWLPIYRSIAADFGYDEPADASARDLADRYLRPFAIDRLDLTGASVGIVVGAALGPTDIRAARGVDHVLATGDAVARLERAHVPVRLAVTDLDSNPAAACTRTRRGLVVAVHAHGDNRDALRRWLPRMRRSSVLGTTQVRPTGACVNLGGFTDGDRAAFLADGLGAGRIRLIGWDLGDDSVGPIKRRKLDWAARLLSELERRRGERFDALDGHRADHMRS